MDALCATTIKNIGLYIPYVGEPELYLSDITKHRSNNQKSYMTVWFSYILVYHVEKIMQEEIIVRYIFFEYQNPPHIRRG